VVGGGVTDSGLGQLRIDEEMSVFYKRTTGDEVLMDERVVLAAKYGAEWKLIWVKGHG